MRSDRLKRSIVLYVFIALMILTSLSFCINSGLYARFSTVKTVNSSARVASFTVSVGESYSVDKVLFDNISPGKNQSYTIEVVLNSEVAVRCLVRLSSTCNLPLAYSINGVNLEPNDATAKTVVEIEPNKGSVELKLIASWPLSANDLSYLGEIDAVQITITVEQID